VAVKGYKKQAAGGQLGSCFTHQLAAFIENNSKSLPSRRSAGRKLAEIREIKVLAGKFNGNKNLSRFTNLKDLFHKTN